MKNISFSHHWTETDTDVLKFLETCFGERPKHLSMSYHGDAEINGSTIEIKSCREWIKTSTSNGTRRRGHFYFGGHEKADYILFVLVHENGSLSFHLDSAEEYLLGKKFKINHSKIFGG